MADLHHLLLRQLKRVGIEDITQPPGQPHWEELIKRITRYAERYFDDEDGFTQMLASMGEETHVSNSLVKKFVDRILLD